MSRNDYLPRSVGENEALKKIRKIKFCIIANFKPEIRKLNLMLFARDSVC